MNKKTLKDKIKLKLDLLTSAGIHSPICYKIEEDVKQAVLKFENYLDNFGVIEIQNQIDRLRIKEKHKKIFGEWEK